MNPNTTWDLTVVDDGCPSRSGAIAAEILDRLGETERARVLWLADAIEGGNAPVQRLKSTNESRKGGSIQYGMWAATETAAGLE